MGTSERTWFDSLFGKLILFTGTIISISSLFFIIQFGSENTYTLLALLYGIFSFIVGYFILRKP